MGFGGNLGSDDEILARFAAACAELEGHAEGAVARSPVYRSEPWGPVRDQPRFLNQVIRFESRLEPRPLLALLLSIEQQHGRSRVIPQGPRTLDLDLLLYGDRVINEPDLVVPHPRLGRRPFVLAPLLDLLGGPPERLF